MRRRCSIKVYVKQVESYQPNHEADGVEDTKSCHRPNCCVNYGTKQLHFDNLKAALAWLKAIQLPPSDHLELQIATEDLELLQRRVQQLDAAIAEPSVEDEDAQLIVRTGPAMRAWFKKIKCKQGGGVAFVAVMRRMATILWHMLNKRFRNTMLSRVS